MKTSRSLRIFALLLAILFVLPSCTETTQKPSDSTDPETTAAPGPEPVVTSDPHIDDVPIVPEDAPEYDPAVTIFVSPYGDDETGDGSWATPYATFVGAKEAAKVKSAASDSPITVYFRGGTYHFLEPAVMDEADSGKSEDAPILYKAWDDESVLFAAGYHIEPARIKSAADSPIAAVVKDPEAASKLMVVDINIEDKLLPGYHAKYNHYNCSMYDRSTMAPEVYLGDSPLKRARWPKDEMVIIDNIMSYTENRDGDEYDGVTNSWTLRVSRSLAKQFRTWSPDSVKYVGMVGYLANSFTYEHFHLYQLDPAEGLIRFRTFYGGWGETPTPRAYFENIPEEIALPGESYLDEENKLIYFYPTEDFDVDHVYYGDVQHVIQMTGTQHIVFEGIDFRYSINSAIKAENIQDLTLRDCRIAHTSSYGVDLEGTKILISGCEIYDTNLSSIQVKGGDDRTLTSGECIIENCLLHDILRNMSYRDNAEGMIRCLSHGAIIRNNEMYGAVGRVLVIEAGEVLIEYNEIYDSMTDCADMGVLYYFANVGTLGMVVRYNYFHDNGNSYCFNQNTIYLDGCAIPPEIYGNIFCNASGYNEDGITGAINLGGSEFAHIYNNIFVDNNVSVYSFANSPNKQWIFEWYGMADQVMLGSWTGSLQSCDFDSEIYHNRFDGTVFARFYDFLNNDLIAKYQGMTQSELQKLDKELYAETGKGVFPRSTNIVEKNIQVNNKSVLPENAGGAPNYRDSKADENHIFVDYENRDFHLTEEGLAKVREVIPDFVEIPIDQIGRFAND